MDQLPRLGKRELICLLSFACNYVVFVWRGFLFLWVLGMGYVILLWHSLSLPYDYFVLKIPQSFVTSFCAYNLLKYLVSLVSAYWTIGPLVCIYETKDADQLHSNCTADQRLCFRIIDNTIPLFCKSEISSL